MICKSCQIYKRRGRLRSFGPVKLPPTPPGAGHQNSSSPLLHFSYLSFPLCLLSIRTRRELCNRCKFTKQSQTSFRKVRTQYISAFPWKSDLIIIIIISGDWFRETLFKLHWLQEKCMKSEWKIWSSFPELDGFAKYTSRPFNLLHPGRKYSEIF